MSVSPYTFAHTIAGRKQELEAPYSGLRIRVPSGSEQFEGVDGQ
jgi:hypothetical protein